MYRSKTISSRTHFIIVISLMKVLVVDGYSSKPSGRDAFQKYFSIVKKVQLIQFDVTVRFRHLNSPKKEECPRPPIQLSIITQSKTTFISEEVVS